ncbi:TolC family protein [Gloeobacter kilaueensis]|uniref:Cobalt-zinc-cadmium resistance protein CzcC n=1 Tax=Gloeobacter kilaueensis (strain ATCC BAA-2537 / CCAP 1431/1 / ULC 316 / JS1) TaxID=1183438 RepID=U5QKS0_GLOK1|nr:TolC family protein [Gloeobacter kilaueensis]AGY58275.1 cobalt-zinc-cadmium resistance protein CzcC [Gloeobacter kilaueensis JS1]
MRLSKLPGIFLAALLGIPDFGISACAQVQAPSGFQLTLSEAFARADERNPQLVTARRILKIGQADITIAGAVPNPIFSVAYGFFDAYALFNNLQQVSIAQTFELGGKRDARLQLAANEYELTQLQLNAQRFDIHSQVRRAYAEFATSEAQVQAIDEQIRLLRQLVELVRKRFNAGAVAEAELFQAELARNQGEPQRTTALSRVQRSRVQLNALLGESPQTALDVRDKSLFNLDIQKTELTPTQNTRIPSAEELLERAYAHRLDLRVAVQQTAVARAQLRVADSLRTPDVQAIMGITFTANNIGDPQTQGLLIGANIPLPVFYNQRGEIFKAEAVIEQSELQTTAIRAQIAAEVQTAYQDLTTAQENIRRYQKRLLPDSAEVVRLARRSYEVGKAGLATVILAQQSDQQIRSAYLDTVVAYQNAWADIEKATGTELSEL